MDVEPRVTARVGLEGNPPLNTKGSLPGTGVPTDVIATSNVRPHKFGGPDVDFHDKQFHFASKTPITFFILRIRNTLTFKRSP